MFPDSGASIINRHKIFNRFPKQFIKVCTCIKGATRMDAVLDRNSQIELGYIYNIPTLHYVNEGFIFDDRQRQIKLLIKELSKLEIKLVSAPFIADIFDEEDIERLHFNDIHVLDLNFFHILTMYMAGMELLKILKRQLPYMNVGIWRGDTQIGELWVSILAPYFNNMTIGGFDRYRLDSLSHRTLKETGLSCEVTNEVERCIKGKDLIILTEAIEVPIREDILSLFSYPINVGDLKNMSGKFMFCSGIVDPCCRPVTDMVLNTWERLALNHTLFYMLNGSCRQFIDLEEWNYENIKKFLNTACYLHSFSVKELVSSFGTMTYDRFRMLYFNNTTRSKKVG